jgi:hypothetical protein
MIALKNIKGKAEIQNRLMEFQRKLLQWFGHVK